MIEKREANDEVVNALGHRLIDALNEQASEAPGVTPIECATALIRSALCLVDKTDDSWFDVLLDILEEQSLGIYDDASEPLLLSTIQCAGTMQ